MEKAAYSTLLISLAAKSGGGCKRGSGENYLLAIDLLKAADESIPAFAFEVSPRVDCNLKWFHSVGGSMSREINFRFMPL